MRGGLLNELDILSILIAAIGHDLDHPGLANAYMAKVEQSNPQIYANKKASEDANNRSFLENHHIKVLMGLIA